MSPIWSGAKAGKCTITLKDTQSKVSPAQTTIAINPAPKKKCFSTDTLDVEKINGVPPTVKYTRTCKYTCLSGKEVAPIIIITWDEVPSGCPVVSDD